MQLRGKKRPLIHILMPDGRVAEFKSRAVVVPESGEESGTHDGTVRWDPFFTPDGDLALLDVPAVALSAVPNPEAPLSWKQVAQRLGVLLSTAKRLVNGGKIDGPKKVSGMKRRVQSSTSMPNNTYLKEF